jgi:hypothetical protein
MKFLISCIISILFLKNACAQNPLQLLIENTNYLIYNSSSIIEDTTSFFPSYDFIIVVRLIKDYLCCLQVIFYF